MVTNITAFSGDGLKDWLWQRITAVILGLYALTLFCFFVKHPELDYLTWLHLFQCNFFKLFSVITLFSFVVHAWIGLWTVTTDYLKCVCVRLTIQVALIIFFLGLFIWGLDIFWSI